MSLQLNGLNQWLETASAVITTYPATFAAWINLNSVTVNNAIIQICDESRNDAWFMMEAQGGTTGDPIDAFGREASQGTSHARTSTGFTAGVWFPIIAVFESATDRRSYIAGGSVGTDTTSRTPAGLDLTVIGAARDTSPGSYTDGLIAHAAIFDIGFSAQNIADFSSGKLPEDLGIPEINLRTYLKLTNDSVDSTGNFVYTENGSPTFSALEPPVVSAGVELTPIFDAEASVIVSLSLNESVELPVVVEARGSILTPLTIITPAPPVWNFGGDSQTKGEAVGPPSNSPPAVIALLESGVTVSADGVSGSSLEETRQRYLANPNRADFAKVIFQESGSQDNDGQRTADDFLETLLATIRDIAINSPNADIYIESAYSFEREAEQWRNWGTYEDPLTYNGKLPGAILTLAGEGITVHLARVDKEIKELVTQITYDVVCVPNAEPNAFHYQAPGNLLIGLSHMVQMGYDVRALDLSPITDVSAPNKAIILDIVDPDITELSPVFAAEGSIEISLTLEEAVLLSPVFAGAGSIATPITISEDLLIGAILTGEGSIIAPITLEQEILLTPLFDGQGSIEIPISITGGVELPIVMDAVGSIVIPLTIIQGNTIILKEISTKSDLFIEISTKSDLIVEISTKGNI